MKLPVINTLVLVAILSFLTISYFEDNGENKEAYVVTNELFTAFEYQKELDQEFLSIKSKKIEELESVKSDLIELEDKLKSKTPSNEELDVYNDRYRSYMTLEQNVSDEIETLNSTYTIKIWEKLNELIKRFGEENNYQMILGANGDGNILYAKDQKNITKELIEFCNLKYNGK